MADSIWSQDKEVCELIEYFDQDEKVDQWDRVTAQEAAIILKEGDRCRKDFIYAARNYFKIVDKQLGYRMFTLWSSQELILQKILEIKAKGRPQKLIIIKARQLGCSTLVEALIAWRTMFFPNVNALVVSKDINHVAYALWPIMQFIYDNLPWWLKPMCAMRKAEEGLEFNNPKYAERRSKPGLNSRIYVKGAVSGAGQGIRLSAAHISEFADMEDEIGASIIEEDMGFALVDDANTVAILESTAKGANRYAHHLWKRCEQMADNAVWFPLFLPWFFEDGRARVVMPGFSLDAEDIRMRERVVNDWVRCVNPRCRQYHTRHINSIEDRAGTTCVTCGTGIVQPYSLTNEQLNWIQNLRHTAERDDKSMKKLSQEMCCSAEEAFQISGYQVFGVKEQSFAVDNVRSPIAIGDLDNAGRIHGPNPHQPKREGRHGLFFPCFQEDCTIDHSYDPNPLQIWEMPVSEAQYFIGGDVAGGLGGKSDYSVGVVIRYDNNSPSPSYQVATWRSNEVDPMNFAAKLFHMGMLYNQAQIAVEVNKFDLCLGSLRFNLNYPNLYRWKNIDSVNTMSQKYGWETNYKSKNRLWQTYKVFLKQQIFIPKSKNLCEEMQNFVKEHMDDMDTGGDKDTHDDEVMATMIAVFCAHEGTYNEALGMAMPRDSMSLENSKFHIRCQNCGHVWPENEVHDSSIEVTDMAPLWNTGGVIAQTAGLRCKVCGSRRVEVTRNTGMMPAIRPEGTVVVQEVTSGWNPEKEWDSWEPLPYDLL